MKCWIAACLVTLAAGCHGSAPDGVGHADRQSTTGSAHAAPADEPPPPPMDEPPPPAVDKPHPFQGTVGKTPWRAQSALAFVKRDA